jgi:hypothetical protein
VILDFVITPLPRRERGATLRNAVLRELEQPSDWDRSEDACLRILRWLRRPETEARR